MKILLKDLIPENVLTNLSELVKDDLNVTKEDIVQTCLNKNHNCVQCGWRIPDNKPWIKDNCSVTDVYGRLPYDWQYTGLLMKEEYVDW